MLQAIPWPNRQGIGLRGRGLQARVLPGSFLLMRSAANSPRGSDCRARRARERKRRPISRSNAIHSSACTRKILTEKSFGFGMQPRGDGATAARLPPNQKAGSSNPFCPHYGWPLLLRRGTGIPCRRAFARVVPRQHEITFACAAHVFARACACNLSCARDSRAGDVCLHACKLGDAKLPSQGAGAMKPLVGFEPATSLILSGCSVSEAKEASCAEKLL